MTTGRKGTIGQRTNDDDATDDGTDWGRQTENDDGGARLPLAVVPGSFKHVRVNNDY